MWAGESFSFFFFLPLDNAISQTVSSVPPSLLKNDRVYCQEQTTLFHPTGKKKSISDAPLDILCAPAKANSLFLLLELLLSQVGSKQFGLSFSIPALTFHFDARTSTAIRKNKNKNHHLISYSAYCTALHSTASY